LGWLIPRDKAVPVTTLANDELDAVWRQFSGDLGQFIRRRVDRAADADDILGQVFLRMTERLHTVRDSDRLPAWLYATTRNAITDHYRSAVTRRELPVERLPEHVADTEPMDPDPAEAELARCLLPMIDRLPAEQAEAIRMVDLGGMTQTAAAAAVNISVTGMKSRVQRGRARLREMLLTCCAVERDVRGRVQDYTPRARPADDCSC
jgi:RNA polymerase sigma-70 factor (ECF subfamily)